ncbi:hypothetical protein SDC9_183359 [bioreactor metagenome]|uniref:Uncharacterized protein n=1 Tax=bioreactor metagenome TaxID=1076179 RepID=A0A645HA07_9ZZZZ
MVISFPVKRDGFSIARKGNAFHVCAHLPNAGKRCAEISQRHIQRTTVNFRYGKA